MSGKCGHILYVEDDLIDQMAFERFVEKSDFPYSFDIAESVAEARIHIAQKKYDAIVMDYDLGNGTCSELWDIVKDIPFIVLTGVGSEDIAVKAMKSGAADYLIKDNEGKGLHLLTMAVTIQNAIEKKKTEKELENYRKHLEELVQKRTKELRKSEEKFRRIAEKSYDFILICDINGTIDYVSPAIIRIIGIQPENMIGKNFTDYVVQDDKKMIQDGLNIITQDKVVQSQQMRLQNCDGSVVTVEFNAVPIKVNDKIVACQAIARDISERIELQEQLVQSQKMEAIGQLAGGIAHDFNNLLTVINGYCEILLNRTADNPDLSDKIQIVLNAGLRAARLTSQLLAFSRRQIMQAKIVDINVLIKDMEKMLRRLIGEDVLLKTTLLPKLSKIKIDPNQFEQILMNIVVNARDAMPQGGSISIETNNVDVDTEISFVPGEPKQCVEIKITDTGVGMDDLTQTRIFDPFFTTKERGTGLGLATVYGIVKQSGGEIFVNSEPDKGTTFRIIFPINHSTEEGQTPQIDKKPELKGDENILIVEDEKDVRELARSILEYFGYSVYTANNGQDALNFLSTSKVAIDAMVVDVIMPYMGGKEFVDQALKRFGHKKILYISGYLDDKIRQNIGEEFTSTLLLKPFSPHAFARKIRAVLDT